MIIATNFFLRFHLESNETQSKVDFGLAQSYGHTLLSFSEFTVFFMTGDDGASTCLIIENSKISILLLLISWKLYEFK